jgi:hypothetical protein
LAVGTATSAAVAQTSTHPANQIPPTRREFVFHVKVDPMFGDNAQATLLNPQDVPTTLSPLRPLSVHMDPGDASDPHPVAGVLQHAPYAFRTLTGGNGAIAYAQRFLPNPTSTPPQVFWSNTFTFDAPYGITTFYIRQVVIHCLPGLYGPFGGALPQVDPASGIPFNGEGWPASLPSFMSIQGTSALDTIFDARGQQTAIISVPANANRVPQGSASTHDESFIDSVTIRNARVGLPGAYGTGAGIYVWPGGVAIENNLGSLVKITNCVIVNNTVGVGVDSYHPIYVDVSQHVRIVNNTIAWNNIGVCLVWQHALDHADAIGQQAPRHQQHFRQRERPRLPSRLVRLRGHRPG